MHQRYIRRLEQQCAPRGIVLGAPQLDALGRYVEFLQQWRRTINLTGLRHVEQMIDVLVAESLDFLWREALPYAARVLDLGTGAGVPGIPLAICAPDLSVTLLDRSQKKITFLRHIVPRLQLRNCQPVCSTAEDLARHHTSAPHFDAVVTRGVGTVAALLALAAPLLRPGGALVLRKPVHTAELQEAEVLFASGGWAQVKTKLLPVAGRTAWMLLAVWRAGAGSAAEAGRPQASYGLQPDR
jgi:16S rRNA (guanine527-N7)-methyltransferase